MSIKFPGVSTKTKQEKGEKEKYLIRYFITVERQKFLLASSKALGN